MSPRSDIGSAQLHLVERARAFVCMRSARGLDVAVDPECYLNPWAQDIGNSRLHNLVSGWRALPSQLSTRMKDVARLLLPGGFDVAATGDGPLRQFETMIVSWARASDFGPDGVYSDRYFRVSSADAPDVLWFLLSADGVLPPKIGTNVRICHAVSRRQGLRRYNSRIGAGMRSLALNGSRPRIAFPSHARATAATIAFAAQSQLRSQRVRRLVMAYEAQPFQHAVNLAAKALDPGIVTVGYHHSSLTALPTDLVYRYGAPDHLFVHGSGQAEILGRHLGWPTERLHVIDSLRYRWDDPAPLAKHILLPYSFESAQRITAMLEEYLRNSSPRSMPRWSVRNHPMMTASREHVELENKVQAIVSRYEDRMTTDSSVDRQTLIIGATAAVLEALERGLDVVHICTHPLFEAHTSAIWSRLDVQTLAPGVYRYGLKESGSYIRLGAASQPAARRLDVFLGDI